MAKSYKNGKSSGAEHHIKGNLSQTKRIIKTPVKKAKKKEIENQNKITSDHLLLNNFIDTIPDNIYFKDLDSRFIKANKATAQKLGFVNPENLIGKTDFDFFDEENAAGAFKDEQEIIKTGKPYISTEKKEVWKDGKVTWAISHKMPTYDEARNIIGTFGFTRDITERKKAEIVREALFSISEAAYTAADMNTLYQRIYEVIVTLMPAKNIYIAIYDEKTDLISFPYYRNEFVPQPILRKPKKEITEYLMRMDTITLLDENKFKELNISGEIEVIETPPKILLGAPLKVGGKTIGVIVLQDNENEKAYGEDEKEILIFITEQIANVIERKRNYDAIQKYAEELRQLNETKDKFFSIIAHDLRSPFQGFLGLTKGFAEEASTYSAEEFTQLSNAMHQMADNLFSLLNNLLEWAQMQKGAMSFQPKELTLSDLIAENVELIKGRSAQKGIAIINAVSDHVYAHADEKMINSILLNLLSNAIKFSNRNGTVTISTKRTEDQMIEIAICDTGIGMQKNLVERLFRAGEKTGKKGTDGELSTGLGLLLCKEFVEKNGGRIWVESEKGVGSTFYFTLPEKDGSSHIIKEIAS
jgi:PAS domain S-box-containing protein